MELYIQVSFWLLIVGVILRFILIANKKHPYTLEKTMGSEVVSVVISLCFAAWSGLILFGGN